MSSSIVHKGVTTVKINRHTAHARSAIAALVLGACLVFAAACAAPVASASTTNQETIAHTARADVAILERGRSAQAEAAIDTTAHALSAQQGYAPNTFDTRLYTIPSGSKYGIVESFDLVLQSLGWAPAPQLQTTGDTSSTVGWTRAGGREAVVVGYGSDGEPGRMFVTVLQAAR
jgi:hypothetical protein